MRAIPSRSHSTAALAASLYLATALCHAAEPSAVVEKGDARAEVVFETGGVVKDSALRTKAPTVITDEKKLKALWKAWKLDPAKTPTVDFATQFVTAVTWTGSGIDMMRSINGEGNLIVRCGGGTKDLVDGFTYLIEVYSHTGVKSVNGKKLPGPKAGKPKAAKAKRP